MDSYLAHAANVLGIIPYLDNPNIREIRITSQGHCFVIDSTIGKRTMPDVCLDHLDSFLSLIAAHHGCEWSHLSPRLSTGSPSLGFRIQAARSPVSPGPNMVLRKHPSQVFTLDDFVTDGILSPSQKDTLTSALDSRQTIVVAGDKGSGKTSLVNASLDYLTHSGHRFVIVGDTPELISSAPDTDSYYAVPSQEITLRHLCADMLRESPDWVIVEEVRGGEVLDVLRACQTGSPGMFTIHSKSALGTLAMIEQRIQEVSQTPQQELIADAVDYIVHMCHHKKLFRVTEIRAVDGWTPQGGYATRKVG